MFDWSQRSRVWYVVPRSGGTIRFSPNPANERQNALPAGMGGCKLWYALGGIPTNDGEIRELQPTVYSLQPIRMRTGPFCDPAIATVTL